MSTDISFKRGRRTPTLFKFLKERYAKEALGERYIVFKWEEWGKNRSLSILRAVKNSRIVGWVFYDGKTSTIEEILVHAGWKGKDPRGAMIDTLINRESLVAASVLKGDVDKYQFLLGYGFRPASSSRSDGHDIIKMELSTAVLLNKTQAKKPFRSYRKRERVAIEKVPPTQTYDEIKQGVLNLIEKLGGIRRFVKPGQTVAIKPNIVSDHGLKDGKITGGIVTDIRVIKAITEILLGTASHIYITEGSSINRSATSAMFAHYGYGDIVGLDPQRITLVDLNNDGLVEKHVPGAKRLTSRKVPATLEMVDVIINVPVLKIHFAAIVSLSIKNLQGAMPPLEKYMSHFFGLWQNLVNIHHLIKPKLIIIDGLTGLEDFGPVSGIPKKTDMLIGGTNPVAVDSVAMQIMGLDPKSSPPVFLAWMQGLGPLESNKIDIAGASIKDVAQQFVQPAIDVSGSSSLKIHAEEACPGCKGYLHFVLSKLRKPDPANPGRLIIDRPLDRPVNVFLGPSNGQGIRADERNIFLGLCQQHNAEAGTHLPGCPPHAEVLTTGIFNLFPDIERPKYADETEESKLGKLLEEILKSRF
ncbi:MAG: DUF362 domain-containing protein [Syntrophorhabdaceae bacterium]|nr:DUF362 domain-containing protein [Syntrophorhabdaceae bacterium]MDD4195464.1 DUF362 domain-containing protein [Syntrophorhabdaceae bacterium]